MQLIYDLKYINKTTLLSNGYRLFERGDKDGSGIYIKTIPLHKYKGYPILYGKITVGAPSGEIAYDVADYCGQLYAPFYNPECHSAHKDFLNKLKKVLNAEIKNLDTKPKKRKNVRKSNFKEG